MLIPNFEWKPETKTRIEQVAHDLWERAGRPLGMAMDFWLDAEKYVVPALREPVRPWFFKPTLLWRVLKTDNGYLYQLRLVLENNEIGPDFWLSDWQKPDYRQWARKKILAAAVAGHVHVDVSSDNFREWAVVDQSSNIVSKT